VCSLRAYPEAVTDVYRYRLGWGPAARAHAAQRVRDAIAAHSGLLETSAAVAEEVCELFMADACSITLLDDSGYRDLVNVGRTAPGEERFPSAGPYPAIQFPLATSMLLDGGGYLSSTSASALYQEFQAMWPQHPEGSFLGVPIVAAGVVRGELYLARSATLPVFTNEDVDAARDLATLYGTVLPTLLT
jgi:GAF domain-containing protein